MLQSLAKTRKTTLAGTFSTLTGIIVAFIPHEVWSACSASITESNSPVLVASLVIAGLGLTIVGPSIAKPQHD